MDRGAWWATVHGVAKSHTQLSIAQQSSDREGFLYKNRCLGGRHFKSRETQVLDMELAVYWQAGEGVGRGCLLCQCLEMGVLGLWRGEAPLGAGEGEDESR